MKEKDGPSLARLEETFQEMDKCTNSNNTVQHSCRVEDDSIVMYSTVQYTALQYSTSANQYEAVQSHIIDFQMKIDMCILTGTTFC